MLFWKKNPVLIQFKNANNNGNHNERMFKVCIYKPIGCTHFEYQNSKNWFSHENLSSRWLCKFFLCNAKYMIPSTKIHQLQELNRVLLQWSSIFEIWISYIWSIFWIKKVILKPTKSKKSMWLFVGPNYKNWFGLDWIYGFGPILPGLSICITASYHSAQWSQLQCCWRFFFK